jgi:hypothetical protein
MTFWPRIKRIAFSIRSTGIGISLEAMVNSQCLQHLKKWSQMVTGPT